MNIIKGLVFYSKSVVAVTLLSTCAVYGVLASVVLTLVGKRQYAQWSTARAFYNVVGLFMGIEVEVINAERLEQLPAVFVSNHQSELDILMLGKTFPVGCTVTAKDSLKYVPLLGWFMYLSGTFFLNRSSKEKSVQTLNSALDSLKKNKRAIWIFPEGTRSYSTKLELLPFKKGAFHLAQQAGIPIVPVVVSNTSTIFNPKLGIFNRGTIVCKVLEPINMADVAKENISELTERVHKLMSDEYKKIGYSKATVDTSLPKIAED